MTTKKNGPKIDLTQADASAAKWSVADSTSSSGGVMDRMYFNAIQNRRVREGAQVPPGSSNADMYLQNKYSAPAEQNLSGLSQNRQEYLKEVNERSISTAASTRPDLGLALRANTGIRKAATVSNPNALGGGIGGHGNTIHLAPEAYSPTMLMPNLQMPTNRRMANHWNRTYRDTNPYVMNAINLHSTYPISQLNIKCDNKEAENFILDMAEKIDLQTVVQQTAAELWGTGEVFVYASFDETTGMWDQIYQHNPDFIHVQASPIPTKNPVIYLQPDPKLLEIVNSNDPALQQIREQLDPKVINHVIQNQMIPLDDFSVSHLKFLARPYDTRGTSIIQSVWKDLIMYDRIRESKYVQADSMINPMTLIQVGTDGSEGFYPRAEELEAWRNVFEQSEFDKNFKIITHNAIKVERVGYNGAVMDVTADLNLCIDNILMGLMVPKSVLTQEGASYSSASVALDVMRQRYNSFRAMMASWLEKKIFAPLCELQGFYKLDGKVKKLIVPQVEWNHMTLYDLDNYITHISALVDKSKVSLRTLDRSLGLSRTNENINIREEMIEAAILKKEGEALAEMSLSQLRSLDPSEPISSTDADATGAPGAGLPGAGDSGPPGMPDLNMPMPDMGGGGGGGGPPPSPPPGPDLGAPPGNPNEPPTPPG